MFWFVSHQDILTQTATLSSNNRERVREREWSFRASSDCSSNLVFFLVYPMLQHHFLLSPTPPSSLRRRNSPIFVNPSHPTGHLFIAEHQNPSVSLQLLLLSKQIKIDYQQILKSLKQKSLNLELVIFYPSFISYPFFFNWIRLHHINTPKNENQRKWYLGLLVFIIRFFFIGLHPRKWNQRKCLLGFLACLFLLSEILFWGSIGSVCFFFPAGEIKCQCSSTSMPGLLQKGVGRILKEVKGIFGLMWLDVLSNVLSSHFCYFFFLVELDHVPTEHLQYMDLELGSSTWLFNPPDLESDKFSCPFDGYQFPIFWGIKWNTQLIVSRSRCVQCDTLKKSHVLEFGWL